MGSHILNLSLDIKSSRASDSINYEKQTNRQKISRKRTLYLASLEGLNGCFLGVY